MLAAIIISREQSQHSKKTALKKSLTVINSQEITVDTKAACPVCVDVDE